ncbi:MAG: ribonuclease P protein subunit [Candidatus Thermoplasmatota archaeon]|nr:ribonuclease P protein subunit [Candidatus Thermoplasmatota archaeon]MCL5730535.1 ribonuclease P protein subunit [Candidatus Thermoplasmatota archaeon]
MIQSYLQEFIGKNIRVVESSYRDLQGKCLKVLDESKNMLLVSNGHRTIKIAKDRIRFAVEDDPEIINGSILKMRPEERPKEIRKIRRQLGERNEE